MESTKSLLAKGIFWNALQMIVNQSFSFVLRLVLAKLLLPEQFGVIGMATIFTGFVQILTELGIGAALIQRKEEDLQDSHYHTAFWTGVIWSTILFLIMSFIVGPLAAKFYGEPILRTLIPVISIGILLSPMNLVNKAQLTKRMNFKKISNIDNFANIFSGVISLFLAYYGAGVWALAFYSISIIFVVIPFYFQATKWYPKFHWDKKSFKDIFGFGIYTIGTNIINYIISNIDYLLIGKMLSAPLLGAYTLSFVLTDTFRNRLTAVMNNVMYPIYGKNQNDHKTIKNYYLKIVEYNSVIVYPFMVFLIVFAKPFIIFTFGDKWMASVEPLQILAGSVMFSMMVNSNTVLIRGLGLPGLELKLQLVKAVVFIPSLILGVFYWGLVGASWAILLNKVFAVILAQYTFNNLIGIKISVSEFYRSLRAPLAASAISITVGYLLFLYQTNFIISGFLMLIAYFSIIWLFMKREILMHYKSFKNKR